MPLDRQCRAGSEDDRGALVPPREASPPKILSLRLEPSIAPQSSWVTFFKNQRNDYSLAQISDAESSDTFA